MRWILHAAQCLALCGMFAGELAAQPFLESSGVKIRDGDWNASRNADESYTAFRKIQGGALSQYDYYYQLRLVPQLKISFADCEESVGIVSFFNGLFGTSENSLLIVKAGLQYRWASGGKPAEFLKDSVPLFIAGTGLDPSSMKEGNGCFFDATSDVSFPLLRYNGGGLKQDYDDFQIKFTVEGGQGLSLNGVATIKSLFSQFNAAFSWTDITGARVTAYESAAQKFQDAIVKAGTFKNRLTKTYTMKTLGTGASRLILTVPDLFGDGESDTGKLVIYARLIGSIALDTNERDITPRMIMQSEPLTARKCSPPDIATGKCEAPNQTIRGSLRTLGKELPVDVFDVSTDDGRKQVFRLCDEVRVHATETLKLSTLDALLVRWAATKISGLQDALKDQKRSSAIAQATSKSIEDLTAKCWNADDEKKLQTVAAAMKKKIQ